MDDLCQCSKCGRMHKLLSKNPPPSVAGNGPVRIIHNGDHLDFELRHKDTPPHERPDWPLPSFDAKDWAAAYCKLNPTADEGTMETWFANALMRGFDEACLKANSSQKQRPV